MELKVVRWERATQPTENELRELYQNEGLKPYSWSNAPGDTYPAHQHSYHKVIYVLRGSITWILPDEGRVIETGAGDRLDLPSTVKHAAQVGEQGVTCLEAHMDAPLRQDRNL